MTFAEVREYQPGDDVKFIDWNVTARFNHPYIKVFEEERELTVMLLVDVSGSGEFGTSVMSKKDMMVEIAATIAFSAIQNNDKIGMIFFSDKIEKFIPPQKGKKHTLYLIRELLSFEPESRKTDVAGALRYFTNVIKKHCTAFVISDFMDNVADSSFTSALTIANRKHDVAAIQVYDHRESELPAIGLMKVKDAESGSDMWIDTSSKKLRIAYKADWLRRQDELRQALSRSGVDTVSVATNEDYVKALMKLFKLRA
jgi:uncharacterized protein (DUF58 family)